MKKILKLLLLFLFPAFLFGQDYFEPLGGPQGAFFRTMCFDSTGSLYAYHFPDGIIKSYDNGDSWSKYDEGISGIYVNNLATLPSGDVVFLANGEFYKLKNGEDTWKLIHTFSESSFSNIIDIDDDGNIYITYENLLYRSIDEGENFEVFYDAGSNTIYKMCINGNDKNYVWGSKSVANQRFLFRLSDQGELIEKLDFPDAYYYYDWHYEINKGLFIATNKGLWHYNEANESWSDLTPNPLSSNRIFKFIKLNDNKIYAIGSKSNLVSNNGGVSFIKTADWPFVQFFNSGYVTQSGNGTLIVSAGSLAGLFRSFNGGENWERLDKSFSTPSTYLITKDYNGVLYASNNDVYRFEKSFDDGQTWMSFFINDSIEIGAFAVNSENTFYAVNKHGNIYRSLNNGLNWELIYSLLSNSWAKIKISPNDEIFAFDSYLLHRSNDNGETWSTDSVSILDVQWGPDGTMFWVNYGMIKKSYDNGVTWDTLPNFYQYETIYDFHVDVNGTIYKRSLIIDDDFYYISKDNGETFESFLDVQMLHPFFFTTNSHGDVIISDYYNVSLKKYSDDEWINISNGLQSIGVNYIFIDDYDYIYLGMDRDVIYKSLIPSTTITPVNEMVAWPAESKISPNPFFNSFKFEIENNFSHPLIFQLKNQNGISVIEKQFTGKTFEINRNGLPSGVYFYSIYLNEKIISSGKVIAQ